ncbi:unnamed protein product, partial [marine sediment metagenome]
MVQDERKSHGQIETWNIKGEGRSVNGSHYS